MDWQCKLYKRLLKMHLNGDVFLEIVKRINKHEDREQAAKNLFQKITPKMTEKEIVEISSRC